MAIKCLGFILSDEDLAFEEKAKREALEFFKTYGKVHKPHKTNEPAVDNRKPEWMEENHAAAYAGVPVCVLKALGRSNIIMRREYQRNKKNIYYEYRVGDIEEYLMSQRGGVSAQ